MKYKLGLAVIAVLFMVGSCLGAPLTYTFEGTLVSSTIENLGSSVSGSFTYDTDANMQSDNGSYVIYDAVGFTVSTSNYSFTANQSSVLIANDWDLMGTQQDGYNISGSDITSAQGYAPYSFALSMLSANTGLFAGTELVALPLEFMPTLYFMKPNSFLTDAQYRINAIKAVNAQVPEPGTLILLGVGCCMMAVSRIRNRK